ncbi:hypothetical protein VTK56DRAFT_6807 [Thermocarpiscus australiensis]
METNDDNEAWSEATDHAKDDGCDGEPQCDAGNDEPQANVQRRTLPSRTSVTTGQFRPMFKRRTLLSRTLATTGQFRPMLKRSRNRLTFLLRSIQCPIDTAAMSP